MQQTHPSRCSSNALRGTALQRRGPRLAGPYRPDGGHVPGTRGPGMGAVSGSASSALAQHRRCPQLAARPPCPRTSISLLTRPQHPPGTGRATLTGPAAGRNAPPRPLHLPLASWRPGGEDSAPPPDGALGLHSVFLLVAASHFAGTSKSDRHLPLPLDEQLAAGHAPPLALAEPGTPVAVPLGAPALVPAWWRGAGVSA